MSDILLKTKLYVPAMRPKFVSRSRLTDVLFEGLSRKLTVISAPAGSGKTTLVSDFASQIDSRVAWLSLDSSDNDGLRFMAYLVAAFRMIESGLGINIQPLLASPKPPTLEMTTTMLINDIVSLNKEIVLVLDDYHVIKSQTIHDALAFLLDNSPPNLNVIVTSRTNPPLQLSRLRARGQLTEIRIADLRFTSDEATRFMKDVMGLNVEEQTISFLEKRTEGWITGLQLAALSLQRSDDENDVLRSFSGRDSYVLDYLVDEVISHQADAIRSFLLRTSLLDRFTASLCNAITGSGDCSAIISELEQANLFLIPLDNERKWYRYHHLFAEFLRARLQEQLRTDELIHLHYLASEWHKQNGHLDEAVEHAFHAQDYDSAAEMIEHAADGLYSRGAISTLYSLLQSLPEEARRRRPRSSIYYAWVLLFVGEGTSTGDSFFNLADEYLRCAEKAVDPASEESGMIYAVRTAMASRSPVRRSVFCAQRDLANIIRCGQRALALLRRENLIWRCEVNVGLGIAYELIGSIKEATNAFSEASKIGSSGGNLAGALFAYASWAALVIQQGNLHEAEHIYRDAMRVTAARDGDMLSVTGQIYAGLGRLFYEWNDLDRAAQFLSDAIRRFETGGTPKPDTILMLALVRFLQNDKAAAKELSEQAAELIASPELKTRDLTNARIAQIGLLLAEGNTIEAAKLAITLTPDLLIEPDPWIEKEYLSLARVLIAQEQPAKIIRVLEKLNTHAINSGRTGSRIEISSTLAAAYQLDGRNEDAILLLKESLALAEQSLYTRTFVDLRHALSLPLNEIYQGIKRDRGDKPSFSKSYIERLLLAFRESDSKSPASSSSEVNKSLIEPFSDRELEIISLISAGHSNQEIADKLFVAVSTIKWHINNIYGKLQVTSRTQAIVRTQQLGLLPVGNR